MAGAPEGGQGSMGLEGGREVSAAWVLLFPQVSRDLWVPEAEGLCHLVLLEAKVPTGWKYRSQKLLHCPSIWSAIAGLEDLETEMTDVSGPTLTLHWPPPEQYFSSCFPFCSCPSTSHTFPPFLLLYITTYQSPVSSLWHVEWENCLFSFLFPFSNFPACPPHPMTHTQLHAPWSYSPQWR